MISRTGDELSKIEVINREADHLVKPLTEVLVPVGKTLKVHDQNRRRFVNVELFVGLDVFLALRAIPVT